MNIKATILALIFGRTNVKVLPESRTSLSWFPKRPTNNHRLSHDLLGAGSHLGKEQDLYPSRHGEMDHEVANPPAAPQVLGADGRDGESSDRLMCSSSNVCISAFRRAARAPVGVGDDVHHRGHT